MWNCKGCEESCCRTKIPELTESDVQRIGKTDKIYLDIDVFRIKRIDGACSFLENNLCTIYKNRPLACRLYPYNPIIHQSLTGYTIEINSDKTCKEIRAGKSFNVKPIALQWRKERIDHDRVYKK